LQNPGTHVFEVAPEDVDAVLSLTQTYDLTGAVVRYLTDEPNYTVEFRGEIVADIPIGVPYRGAPTCEKALRSPHAREEGKKRKPEKT
jgi:phosphoribosylformylglycinamidine synthase